MKTNAVLGVLASLLLAAVSSATTACSPSCGGETKTTSYTPAQDDAAVAAMQTTWTGTLADGRAFTLAICEDVGNTSVPEVGCDPAKHLIRGEDRGKSESSTSTSSCALGGCIYGAAMNAVGVMTIDGEATTLHGFVQTDVAAYDDATWVTHLESDSGATIQVSFADGRLSAGDLPAPIKGADGGAASEADAGTSSDGTFLKKTGSATCPLAP